MYEINLNNKDFGTILMSKIETFAMQCQDGKRPRITWKDLVKQISSDKIKIIAEGTLANLIDN